jgi:predicted DNA-binding transcriptional regulator YafY
LKPADFYLPYLELDNGCLREDRAFRGLTTVRISEEDAALLDRATSRVAQLESTPLGECARSARHKLGFDLPLSDREVERVLSGPVSGDTAKVLELLQGAVSIRRAVECRYYSIGRDVEEEREIEPYGLFFNWSTWYCVARCRERQAKRVFRVDRMSNARLSKGKDAGFEVPDAFSVRDYVGRTPWELSETEPITVRARFEFPESRWVQAQSVGEAIEPLLEDGGAVVEFQVRDKNPFLRWLLTFRSKVRVLEPESVANDLEQLKKRVAALYEPEERGTSK